ncbi:hypothetical protein CFBP6411_01426 [Pseudomonas syringae group genomosp. 3]|uniref:Uncharacterized protein n=1 Tax=Pseudomonas syringae group genomosp. 3 TaxID=251701 RepID=A0A2K4WA70_9PSED|nr:hypothetical protein CFBP6411_01426 [Pseudomonas syringae group genomosp. 3]
MMIEDKVRRVVVRKEGNVLLRADFSGLGSPSRINGVLDQLVCRLKINFSHACVLIAARARCILFKISSPLAFQT